MNWTTNWRFIPLEIGRGQVGVSAPHLITAIKPDLNIEYVLRASAISNGIHTLKWISWSSADLEVDVWSRRLAALAHIADNLPLHDTLADAHDHGRLV